MGERTSVYRELPPPAALAPYVECLWVHEIGEAAGPFDQPVLPDGCVDLVALGDHLLVAGPATRTTVVTFDAGTVTVGVRFRTGAAPALLGTSAADLRDADHPLEDVWGSAGERLADRLVETARWKARLDVITDDLMRRLPSAHSLDPVGVGIAALLDSRPSQPLHEVAARVGLSERQLRRRVEAAVGYPPRTLVRILRFQRFLRAARAAGDGCHLARLALEAGYADQAHLTRESRDLGGLPPAALLRWEVRRLDS